jgi:hypothetical protein
MVLPNTAERLKSPLLKNFVNLSSIPTGKSLIIDSSLNGTFEFLYDKYPNDILANSRIKDNCAEKGTYITVDGEIICQTTHIIEDSKIYSRTEYEKMIKNLLIEEGENINEEEYLKNIMKFLFGIEIYKYSQTTDSNELLVESARFQQELNKFDNIFG